MSPQELLEDREDKDGMVWFGDFRVDAPSRREIAVDGSFNSPSRLIEVRECSSHTQPTAFWFRRFEQCELNLRKVKISLLHRPGPPEGSDASGKTSKRMAVRGEPNFETCNT